jgi:DNA-directed RNA polymerase subunit RPC12/RpoP
LGHFVLVPAFLIAGPVVFFMKMAEDVSLEGARGICPMCGKEQEFAEHERLLARHPVRCPTCGRQLELIAELPGRTRKPLDSSEKPQEVHVWVAADPGAPEPKPPNDR